MMSNTPRVFVGTTTFLIAGITSGANLQTVIAVLKGADLDVALQFANYR